MAAEPPFVVAITGASGAPYGVRLVEVLLAAGRGMAWLETRFADWKPRFS